MRSILANNKTYYKSLEFEGGKEAGIKNGRPPKEICRISNQRMIGPMPMHDVVVIAVRKAVSADYAEQLRQGAVKKTLYVRGRAYQDGQNWISEFSYQTTCDQFVNTTDNASIVAIVQAEHPNWKDIVVTSAEKSSDNVDI